MAASTLCMICGTPQVKAELLTNLKISCDRCGEYSLTRAAEHIAKENFYPDHRANYAVSHRIRRMQSQRPLIIGPREIEDWLETATLPDLGKQQDNTIIYIGERLEGNPGDYITVGAIAFSAVVGTTDPHHGNQPNLFFVLDHLIGVGLIRVQVSRNTGADVLELSLSMLGWQQYEAIKRATSNSRRIFMAMAFGNTALSHIVKNYFKPAVAQTGFELVRVDDYSKTGSIDDRIRVEIRNSRMLIADLTDQNRGAYWEAGFAEGLGKPVLYICEQAVFDVPNHIHFDTRQLQHVQWDANNPADAAEQLKAIIRNTMPTEARMEG